MSDGKKLKPELRFGTSGLRDLVTNMTDKEVYINTVGFITFLKQYDGLAMGSRIALAGDLRSSTERIMKAVARGIADSHQQVDFCGRIPSPALLYYGMQQGIPSIMVTGSHIPDDRNGVKFAKAEGEILKQEELPILNCVAVVREQVVAMSHRERCFDPAGYFTFPITLPPENSAAAKHYLNRSLKFFPRNCLAGVNVVVYQHSAVGRDLLVTLLKKLGATVIAPCDQIQVSYSDEEQQAVRSETVDLRSDAFIPVDTEKITGKTKAILSYLQRVYKPDFIISLDGDSDRPLVADEQGAFLPGDQLGLLALYYLNPPPKETFLALPVSTNDGVISKLQSLGYPTHLTRIGSPYIVAEMFAANKEEHVNRFNYTVGWEANGGFLLGSSVMVNDRKLSALPTRDAFLPIVAAMLLAKQKRMRASRLFKTLLLPRYTVSAVIDNHTPGLEDYTAETGKQLVIRYTPAATDIAQCTYKGQQLAIENPEGEIREIQPDDLEYDVLRTIKQELENHFNLIGLQGIKTINFIDGIRITFATNNVVYHLRPSGNAPEFRSYVTADTLQAADSIIRKRTVLIRSLMNALQGCDS